MISSMVLIPVVFHIATKIKQWVLDNFGNICNKIWSGKLKHDICIKKQGKVVIGIYSNIICFIDSIQEQERWDEEEILQNQKTSMYIQFISYFQIIAVAKLYQWKYQLWCYISPGQHLSIDLHYIIQYFCKSNHLPILPYNSTYSTP